MRKAVVVAGRLVVLSWVWCLLLGAIATELTIVGRAQWRLRSASRPA